MPGGDLKQQVIGWAMGVAEEKIQDQINSIGKKRDEAASGAVGLGFGERLDVVTAIQEVRDLRQELGFEAEEETDARPLVDRLRALSTDVATVRANEMEPNDVWSFEVDPTVIGAAGTAVRLAAEAAADLRWAGLFRLAVNPHCWSTFPRNADNGNTWEGLDLELLNPAGRLVSESQLEYVQRVCPDLDWEEFASDPEIVSCGVGVDGAPTFSGATVFYLPVHSSASSVAQFKALWDYEPSSGPPTRNGIEDFMKMIALVPLQY